MQHGCYTEGMNSKADVQAVAWEYLHRKNISVSELARRAEIPVATLQRMLRDDPTYRGRPDHWSRLARFRDLHLNEAEVLAAVGLGPPVARSETDTDPWVLLERLMALLNLPERVRVHLRNQLHLLDDASAALRQAGSMPDEPHGGNGSHPSLDRTPDRSTSG